MRGPDEPHPGDQQAQRRTDDDDAMRKPSRPRETLVQMASSSVPSAHCRPRTRPTRRPATGSVVAADLGAGPAAARRPGRPRRRRSAAAPSGRAGVAPTGCARDLRRPARRGRPRRPRPRCARRPAGGSAIVSAGHGGGSPHAVRSVISTDSSATAASSMRRGCGMSTVHSRTIRPGREDSSTTRWPSRTASRTLCVTNRTDTFVSRQIRVSSSCSTSRVIASSAANGSSISSTWLSWASARASATRWRMPPDSSCTRLPYAPVEPDQLEQPLGLGAPLGLRAPRAAAGRVRCSRPRSATGTAPAPGTSGPAGRRAPRWCPRSAGRARRPG